MKVIYNEHTIFNSRNITALRDCSIPVALLPDDNYSAQIKFSEHNFLSLMKQAGLEKEAVTLYDLHREALFQSRFSSAITRFFETHIDESFWDMAVSVSNYVGYEDSTDAEKYFDGCYSCIQEEIDSSDNGFESVCNFLELFRELMNDVQKDEVMSYKPTTFEFSDNNIMIGQYINIKGDDFTSLIEQVQNLVKEYYEDVIEASQYKINRKEAFNDMSKILSSDALVNPKDSPEFYRDFTQFMMCLCKNYTISY